MTIRSWCWWRRCDAGAKDAACTWSLCSIRSGSTNCIDFTCPLESGPSSRFGGQPATGTRRVAGTTHTQSGRRWEQSRPPSVGCLCQMCNWMHIWHKHPTLTQRNQHTTTKRTSQTTFITTQTKKPTSNTSTSQIHSSHREWKTQKTNNLWQQQQLHSQH